MSDLARAPGRSHAPLHLGGILAAALAAGACGAATPVPAATPTLGAPATVLAQAFDPVEIARGLDAGRHCEGRQVQDLSDASYVHLTWHLVCPREPGDRTLYFQLVEATEGYLREAGATIGSGGGVNEGELLFDGVNFGLEGVSGHARVLSNDLDTLRLGLVVTLDEVAT